MREYDGINDHIVLTQTDLGWLICLSDAISDMLL